MKKIVFLIGVSGCGKSTIGTLLSHRLKMKFHDGDYFHPASNIKKMANKQPLTDEDRLPWLQAINAKARECQEGIYACSALKETYRRILSEGLEPNQILWVVLHGSFELIDSRLKARSDHFMPASLLQSQYEVWEKPEYGLSIDISQPIEQIVEMIESELKNAKSEFGLVGLGVMGKSLARNLAQKGIALSVYNRHVPGKEENVANDFIAQYAAELSGVMGFDDLNQFVESLATPRKIMLMVNAGIAVDTIISELRELLEPGDVIIDGGNSHYKDTQRRTAELESIRLDYIGTGVSGGEEGALKGPSIMPGGTRSAYPKVAKYLEKIAAKDDNNLSCCTYIGKGGSGHFVKMVHNGIEYAEMQLIAEVYSILRNVNGLSHVEIADLFDDWCQSDLNSYLLEITAQILRKKEGNQYVVDLILDSAGNKGTGGWTTIAAAELGVPITMITNALFARYTSSFRDERIEASQKYESTESISQKLSIDSLKGAYSIARIINHHQGIHLIDEASQQYDWELKLPEIARIWTNGCIIRSELMKKLIAILKDTTRILQHDEMRVLVQPNISQLSRVVSSGHISGLSIPCFSAASDFIHTYINAQSSANIIQAQRDFFGAHTYKRVDDPNGPSHHTIWT